MAVVPPAGIRGGSPVPGGGGQGGSMAVRNVLCRQYRGVVPPPTVKWYPCPSLVVLVEPVVALQAGLRKEMVEVV